MPPFFLDRRSLLLSLVSLSLGSGCSTLTPTRRSRFRLAQLEAQSKGRLGVAVLDSRARTALAYRGDERFPFCSTFKVMLAASVLRRAERDEGLLKQTIRYTPRDLVAHSPITAKHTKQGMTVAALCAAALQYSDNTAANLLIQLLGGPAQVTEFARSMGDPTFRLDRLETELNTAIPGDARDTTSPLAMAQSLQRLLLGKALSSSGRAQLTAWMLANTTGAERIRAGMPAAWRVADKTGSGSYGTTNDVGVIFPPDEAPFVVAIYFTQHDPSAPMRNDVIAQAAKIVSEMMAPK